MVRHLIIFGLLLTSFFLPAQEKAIDFWSYSKDDGLEGYIFSSIVQDQRGFIWLASNKGVNRFDGTSFKFYSRENLRLKSIDELTLFCDSQNNIWVASTNSSILNSNQQDKRTKACRILNPITDEVQTFSEKFGEDCQVDFNQLIELRQDENFILWFTTMDEVLYKLDNQFEKVFANNSSIKLKKIRLAQNNHYWGLSHKALYLMDQEGRVIDQDSLPLMASEIIEISETEVIVGWQFSMEMMGRWVSTMYDDLPEEMANYGLFPNLHFKSFGNPITKHIDKYNIDLHKYLYVKKGPKESLWAYKKGEIHIFQPGIESPLILDKHSHPLIPQLKFFNIFFDGNSRAWIPYNEGVLIVESKVPFFKNLLHGDKTSVRSIEAFDDESLFVTTYSGLFNCYENSKECNRYTDLGLFYGFKTFKEDSSIYLGSHGPSFIQIDSRTKKVVKDLTKLPFNALCPYIDKTGRIWVGHEAGVHYYEEGKAAFKRFDNFNGFEKLKHAMPLEKESYRVDLNDRNVQK